MQANSASSRTTGRVEWRAHLSPVGYLLNGRTVGKLQKGIRQVLSAMAGLLASEMDDTSVGQKILKIHCE